MAGRSTNWCFTVNNYSENEYLTVIDLINTGTIVKYGIVGREVGEGGTPHLQGYIRLVSRKRLGQVKLLPGLSRAHLEVARGGEKANIEYCSKEGDARSGGTPFGGDGSSGGVARYVSAMADIGSGMAWEDFRGTYPDLAFKHLNAARSIIAEQRRVERPVPGRLREWQRSAVQHLALQNDRKVCVYVDTAGGAGKSTLTRWLLRNHACFVSNGGKMGDLMHAFTKKDWDYAIFDMCRTTDVSYWPYGFTEAIKNGYFTSTKYDSGFYEFNPPKVVWFVNQDVARDRWSDDRYCVHHLLGDTTILEPEEPVHAGEHGLDVLIAEMELPVVEAPAEWNLEAIMEDMDIVADGLMDS